MFTTMGIHQKAQTNEPVPEIKEETMEQTAEAPNQALDERELKKLAAAEAALVRERGADWVQGGVWDHRYQHPVPAYPVSMFG